MLNSIANRPWARGWKVQHDNKMTRGKYAITFAPCGKEGRLVLWDRGDQVAWYHEASEMGVEALVVAQARIEKREARNGAKV